MAVAPGGRKTETVPRPPQGVIKTVVEAIMFSCIHKVDHAINTHRLLETPDSSKHRILRRILVSTRDRKHTSGKQN